MNKKIILLSVGILVLVATTIYGIVFYKKNTDVTGNYNIAQVFKSSTCNCCNGYISALRKEGFEVEAINLSDLNHVKRKHHIPNNMQSCHTTIVGEYFIEGHVPLEVVKKFLNERPDIDGIALPGMPSDTPGMPGIRKQPLVIYQLESGEYSEYVTIK